MTVRDKTEIARRRRRFRDFAISRFRDFAIWFTLALLEPPLVVIAWHDEVVDRIGPDP